jgi:hypothetical protein
MEPRILVRVTLPPADQPSGPDLPADPAVPSGAAAEGSPDATAPDAAVPDAAVPDATASDVAASDVAASEVAASDVAASDVVDATDAVVPAVDGAGLAYPAAFPPVPPRRRGRKLVAGAAVVLVLLVGAATAIVLSAGGKSAKAKAGAASTVDSSPSPSRMPVTPEAYQTMLTAIDGALTPLVKALGTAANLSDLERAAELLSGEVFTARSELDRTTPPSGVESGHAAMGSALSDFQAEVTQLGSLGRSHSLCTAPTVMSELTGSPAATAVRTAAGQLATADPAHPYQIGGFLPATAAAPATSRPASGTLLRKPAHAGSGQLKIENGGPDMAISLVPQGGNTATITMYVQSGVTSTAHGVPNGTYTIYYTTGTQWDPARKAFGKGCTFTHTQDPIKYDSTGSEYDIWTITFDPATEGNNPVDDVDPGAYPTV